MKRLLSWGGVGLVTSALLDPVLCSGLGNPVPWGRELMMAATGIACLFLLVKFRDQL